ncbi:MAG: DNA repair protein RecN, partial [Bacteroidales bacterium]
QEELEKEQELLAHAEEIKQSLENVSQLLSWQDKSILSMLGEIKTTVARICNYLPEGGNIFERINSSYIELNDMAGEITRLSQNIEADPVRLAKLNDRLDLLYQLIQKHRLKDLNELIARRDEIEAKIGSIALGDEKLAGLEESLKSSRERLRSLSVEISEKRKAVLPGIEAKITELLRQLGMPNARFRISLSGTQDFTSSGIDNADFLFSANKQVEPENIARIASGGELSRVMLSLKSVISKNNNLPTIIFDEIDAGVSGEVADKVGQILSGMGSYMQVVNITHLPQVASRGTRHFHVYKEDSGDSTITRIRLLSNDERIMEVARLLSGSKITETALKNARELIRSARN